MGTKTWIRISLLLMCGVAYAQVAPAPAPPADVTTGGAPAPATAAAPTAASGPLITPGVATLGDLDRIQSQIVMTQARTRLAESQQALVKAEGSDKDAPAAQEAEPDVGAAPVVAGVFGTADRPYARFLLAGGGQTVGRKGDVISDGYRVEHVDVDKVVIKDRKGREIVARFSGKAPVVSSGAELKPTAVGDVR